LPRGDISLTPAERALRARVAALTLHSQIDSSEHMKAAQKASPGQLPYWEHQVDPGLELDEVERRRRAECLRRAHMAKLALASAKARRRKKSAA
jgi:hypothetical protein